MTKKKFIWTFVLAFMFILPAMFMLTACGETKHEHTLTDVASVEATCTTAGNIAYKHCTGCDKNFDADGNELENVTIPANGHDLGEEIPEIPATCTETGRKAHKDCNECDGHFDNNGNEIEDWTIPATGHTLTDVASVEAECTTAGNIAYKHCTGCDKNFDADGNELENVTIPATGHDLGEEIQEIPATCTETGRKAHKDCNGCDGHFDYNGNEIEDLTIPVIEHTFGEWITQVDATYSQTGTVGHKNCTVCGKHFDANGVEIADEDYTIAKLEAKERKLKFNNASVTSKLYNGQTFSIAGNYTVYTESTAQLITPVDSGTAVIKFYDKNPNEADAVEIDSPTAVGVYGISITISATDEWKELVYKSTCEIRCSHEYDVTGVCSKCGRDESNTIDAKTNENVTYFGNQAVNYSYNEETSKWEQTFRVYFNFTYCASNSNCEGLTVDTQKAQSSANSVDDALLSSIKVYKETQDANLATTQTYVCDLTCNKTSTGYLEWTLPEGTTLEGNAKYYVVVTYKTLQSFTPLYVAAGVHVYENGTCACGEEA